MDTPELLIAQIATLSGPGAARGTQAVLGARLHFDYINATGGLRGQRIRHLVLDDRSQGACAPRLAEAALQRHGVMALFGQAASPRLLGLLAEEVLAKAGAPWLLPPASEGPLPPPAAGWVFRLDGPLPSPDRPCVPAVREWHALLRRKTGQAAGTAGGLAHFLGAKLLVEALHRAGPRTSRQTLRAALQAMDSCDLGGVTVQRTWPAGRRAA